MPSEYSPKQIFKMFVYVDENYAEPERTREMKRLRDMFNEACKREDAAEQKRKDRAQIQRIRSLYENSGTSADKTKCHVCDGRGRHPALRGYRTCGTCYGKGFI